jgi:DNA-binding transcriptional LysR family regulator
VTGVTPDKWIRVWRRRETKELNLLRVDASDQETVLTEGRADACFVRLPVDRTALHCIPLYDEVPVVVVAKDHPVTAYDEIELTDLVGEQLVHGDVLHWADIATTDQLAFPEMSVKDAIEVVASGTGIVIIPLSVARLHHRKDVEHRPVLGLPHTRIGLAWQLGNEDPRIQTFIGIVRGRTDNSSRTAEAPQPDRKKPAAEKAADKQARRKTAAKPVRRKR